MLEPVKGGKRWLTSALDESEQGEGCSTPAVKRRHFSLRWPALAVFRGMADFPDVVEASLRARFVSLGVRPGEVAERFVRGTGAGGQKINKTSSTVILRHEPTGVEVRCQRERS